MKDPKSAILSVVLVAAVIFPYAVCNALEKHDAAKYADKDSFTLESVQPAEVTTEPETAIPEQEAETVTLYDVPLEDELQLFIARLCENHHIDDPGLVVAMIQKESTYDPDKIGDGGESFGLMQVQPKWHQARMDKHGVTDLLDPYQNVTVAIDYLAELLDRGNGVEWALAAYNKGPTGANNGKGFAYAAKVLSIREKIEERMVSMAFYTDDPVRDAERHQAAQDNELANLPVCCYCTKPIQDEHCFLINDELYCADCMVNHFRVRTGDYT